MICENEFLATVKTKSLELIKKIARILRDELIDFINYPGWHLITPKDIL